MPTNESFLFVLDPGRDQGFAAAITEYVQTRLTERGWHSPNVRILRDPLAQSTYLTITAEVRYSYELVLTDQTLMSARSMNLAAILAERLRAAIEQFPDISPGYQSRRAEEYHELMSLRNEMATAPMGTFRSPQEDFWFTVPTPSTSRWTRIVKGDVLEDD